MRKKSKHWKKSVRLNFFSILVLKRRVIVIQFLSVAEKGFNQKLNFSGREQSCKQLRELIRKEIERGRGETRVISKRSVK